MNIRAGDTSDIETIYNFQLKMALETENLVLDPATVKLGVSAVIYDANKGKYWVALVDNQIVGCLLTIPEWSDWRNGTVLWIHSVYVDTDFRKHGVYAQLYNHLKEMVETSSDLRGLRLYVDKTNTRAQQVYEKLGMNGEHYHLYEWLK